MIVCSLCFVAGDDIDSLSVSQLSALEEILHNLLRNVSDAKFRVTQAQFAELSGELQRSKRELAAVKERLDRVERQRRSPSPLPV